jgi:hypothetical protein
MPELQKLYEIILKKKIGVIFIEKCGMIFLSLDESRKGGAHKALVCIVLIWINMKALKKGLNNGWY